LSEKQFDIIIIGSGISGLTTAALMSSIYKKRVLIIEQHDRIGGYTHTFSRKGYTWDVGFHYIGEIFKKKLAGLVMNFISGGNLTWRKTPEPFETFIYPDQTFTMYGDEKRFRDDLLTRFPEEAKAIRSYFGDIRKVSFWFACDFLGRFLPFALKIPISLAGKLFDRLAYMTTEEYMKRFKNEKLRSILTSQWGNYGLPPSQSIFMIHGLIVNHFINGGYYPEGGSGEIAKNILPQIVCSGGEAIVNSKVTEIIIENNRATGVSVETRERGQTTHRKYYAPVIVSCAGAFNTFTKLISEKHIFSFVNKCKELNKPSACVALYLGLKGDIRSLGITGSNCWIFDSLDHEAGYRNQNLLQGKPSSCFVSFVPSKEHPDVFKTATIIAVTHYSQFEKWKDQVRGNRDKEYYLLKEKIASGLIDFVNTRYPGFSKAIDYYELGTPLSAEHYTDSPYGAMYGLGATPQRYKQKWLSPVTSIKGLYLTGSDISSLGIVPSMMAGMATASALSGTFGLFKIAAHIRRYSRKK